MRSKALLMVLAAGAACSTAMAGPEKRVGARAVERIVPVSIEYRGVVYPVQPPGNTDDNQLVYDNGTTATAGFFSSTAFPHAGLDDLSYTPGPGAGVGQLVNGMIVSFGTQAVITAPTQNMVVEAELFNDMNTTATPINSNSAGAVRITFQPPAAGWAINTAYISAMVDLTALPGGGIQTADDSIGVEFRYFLPGTAPTPVNPDFTVVFQGDGVDVGSSQDVYWRDANANNVYEPSDARFFNGPPNLANFVAALRADVVGGITGACCLADGTCSVIPQSSCNSRTGIYRGDGTTCPSNCAAAFNEGATDAGDLPSTAVTAAGSGPLPGIIGALGTDDSDMYRIQVCDAPNFIATTTTWSSVDTQLFMFRLNGTGITANDDDPIGPQGPSRLTSTFVQPLGNGTYFLAISEFDRDPTSASGDIWVDQPFNTERAPDGPGAASPVTAWASDPTATGGNYVIAFRGACYVGGATCYPDCNADHALNVLDFVCFQSAFAAQSPQADCDHNSALNVLDFVCFQSAFAAGCSQL